MGVRRYKPTSAGRRNMSVSTFEEITKSTPEKSLLEPLRKSGGRNNQGRLTVRHRGGGTKRAYRKIDFKRNKHGVAARVASPGTGALVRIEVNAGTARVELHWPLAHTRELAALLCELAR